MDNKPSLSQYFGESDIPPASQFFDEIGTSPSDMIQSVYLGDGEEISTTAANLFPHNTAASFTQPQEALLDVLPTVSGSTSMFASSLPDPSTFFDTIGPEPQILPTKSSVVNTSIITEAMDSLAVKTATVDKEADRRRDAWLPNEETKKILLKAQSSPKGSFFPDRDMLTMPGLVLEEELPDALHSVAVKYLGVSGAGRQGVARADHVSRDEAGLRELLRAGALRAAANLTAVLLEQKGQGVGKLQRPSKHTALSLQLWLTRFAVMLRIQLLEPLMKEAEAFGDLSKPDLFYQMYPETYGSRPGSLVPFSLRLLLAELPAHAGNPAKALTALCGLRHVITQMIANLREGKTEDGTSSITEEDQSESLRLWAGRDTRVRHSIVNCAIALKDYRQASNVLLALRDEATTVSQRRAYNSALCRLWLRAGHLKAAGDCLAAARECRQDICPTPDLRELVDSALLHAAHARYADAHAQLLRAREHDPTDIMVANNLSVCLLYMGRLKEAIAILQKAIHSDPERGLNESLLVNLCTLYELESSKTQEKKLNLLRMLCKYKSDTIPNVMECLKLN